MAQKRIFVDDIDGSEEGVEEFEFSAGKNRWRIDLSEANRGKFFDAIALYIDHAQEVGGKGRKPKPAKPAARHTNADNAAIRAWVREHGGTIGDRGRIPKHIVEGYNNNDPEAIWA